MQKKDLMIGDWVMCVDSTHENKTYAQIDAIEEGQTCILVRKDNVNWFLDIGFIEAIPLTAEILEKNGIKWLMSEPSGKRTYSCNEPPISCTFIPDRGWYLSAGPVGSTKLPFAEISMAYYVHELQRVIRDAKVDKEIVL